LEQGQLPLFHGQPPFVLEQVFKLELLVQGRLFNLELLF
jgi:hypothetical protein